MNGYPPQVPLAIEVSPFKEKDCVFFQKRSDFSIAI